MILRLSRIDSDDLHGADQRRLDRAGADQADADAVLAQVEAQHLGDAAQAELAAL